MPKFLNDISLEQANDLQFKTAAGANAGKIEQDGNNLVLTNPVGDIMIGDGAADVYIGDGINNVDILFEQSGSIKAEDGTSGVTLTLGSSDTTLALGSYISSTLTVGVNDAGYDVIFYGATSGKKMQWDESADTLIVDGTLDVNGNADIAGNLSLSGDNRILNLAGGTTSSQSKVIIGEQGNYGVAFRWDSSSELDFDGFWATDVTGSRNRDLGKVNVNSRLWTFNEHVVVGGELEALSLDINGQANIGGDIILDAGGNSTSAGIGNSGNYLLFQAKSGDTSKPQFWMGNHSDTGVYTNASQHYWRQIDNTNIATLSAGQFTVAGEIEATSLDINGNADISGTLDVAGKLTISDNQYLSWSSNSRIIANSSYMQFQVAATDKMRILADGSVGIGITSPGAKLDVYDSQNPASGDIITSKVYSNGGVAANGNTRTGLDVETNRTGWYNADATSGNFKVSLSNSGARIGASNLIGLKSLATLDVNNVYSGVSAQGSLTALYGKVTTTFTTGSGPVANAYGLRIDAPEVAASSEISTYYGAYIDGGSVSGTLTNKYALVTEADAGNVGIGTTSPSQKLTVEGNIELGTGGYIYGDTTTPYLRLNNAAGAVLGYSNGYISLGPSFVYNNASGEQFRINHSDGSINTAGNINFTDTTNHNVNSIVNVVLNADSDSNSGDAYRNIIFKNRGTETGRIDKDGNATFSGNATASNLISNGYVRLGADNKLISDGSITIDIDYNNNQTDRTFKVRKDQATDLFTISEDASATFAGKVGIGVTSAVSKLHVYENTSGTDSSTGITVEQDSTGDALVQYLLTGTRRWVTGIDNSDSDKFKIASSADLGTDTRFSLDVSGNATFAGTINSGAITSTGNIQTSGDMVIGAEIMHNGDTNTKLRFDTDQFRVYTGGIEGLEIDSSQNATFGGDVIAGGKVRINATTTTGLEIASSSGATSGLKLFNNSSTDAASIINHYNGDLLIGTNNATVLTMNGTTSTFAGNVTAGTNSLTAGSLDINGNADISGNLAVDGIANLDNTDIDGTFNATGTTFDVNSSTSLTLDNTNTTNGVKINTATSGSPVTIGHTTSEVVIADNLTVNGNLTTKGDTILESTTNTTIRDTVIQLNDGVAAESANSSDSGMLINRGSLDKVFMGWDETADKFVLVTTSSAADAAAGTLSGLTTESNYQTLVANIIAPTMKIGFGNSVGEVHASSTSTSLGTSNTLVPTQNAVKSYVDGLASNYATAAQGTLATNALPKSGGTMSDQLTIQVSTSNNQLKLKRTTSATGEFNIFTNTDTLFFNNVANNSYPLKLDANDDAIFAGSVIAEGGSISTTTGNTPFYITRQGSNAEALSIKVMDDGVRFESIQDETADNYGSFDFRMDSGSTEPDFIIRKGTADPIFNVRGDGNTTFAGSVTTGGTVNINNAGSEKKMSFDRTGGKSMSIEHDTSSMYFYNETDSTILFRMFNAGAATLTGVLTSTGLDINGEANISGSLLVATATDYYSGCQIGVGDTSDSQNGLSITTSTTGNAYVLFGDGTGASSYVGQIRYAHDGDFMDLQTGGAVRLKLNAGGATVTGELEAGSLDINGAADISGTLTGAGATFSSDVGITGTGNLTIRNTSSSGSGIIFLDTTWQGGIEHSAGSLFFRTGGQTDRMVLRNNGNLLLGTTTDDGSNKLQVSGSITASGEIEGGSLDINGNADISGHLHNQGIIYQTSTSGGGFYAPMVKNGSLLAGASTVTGRLRIKIPHYKAAAMQSFIIDIYEYNTDRMQSIMVGGYSYTDTNASWYNTSAIALMDSDNRDLTVRFGADTSASAQYVAVGETNTTWTYPQVVVRDYMSGHSTQSGEFLNAFTIEFVTTDNATYNVNHDNNQPMANWSKIESIPANVTNALPTTGGTMSGAIAMGSQNITGAASISCSGLSASSNITTALVQLQGDLNVLNKAQTSYITLADRDTSGSEVVYNLDNIGTITVDGNIVTPSLTLGANSTVSATQTTDDSLYLQSAGTGVVRVNYTGGLGGFEVYTGNNQTMQLQANSSGITIPEYIIHAGDANTKFGFSGADTFLVQAGGGDKLKVETSGTVLLSDGGNADGSVLYLKHQNNNSTDTIGTIFFGNNADSTLSAIVTETNGANNTSNLKFRTSNAGTIGTALTLNADNSAAFTGDIVTSSSSAVIQTPRISMEADGTLDWGANRDYGTLTWDTNKILIRALSGKAMEFQTNGNTTALTLDTSQNATFAGDIITGGDIINNTGNLSFTQNANDSSFRFNTDDGSGGVAEYFRIDGEYEVNRFLKNARFNDSVKANFGTDDDLQIYHDGSNSYIQDSGTGTLYVKTNSFRVRNSGGSEDIIKALEDGAVTLYYDNAAKLATASGGVNVTGAMTATADVVAYSDKKLKENIKTLDGKKVLDMRGVSFTRKDTGEESSGVIAQEIQKVAPELVHDNEGTLGVAYGNLVGYLIEAVKDQQKQIDELKAIINGNSK